MKKKVLAFTLAVILGILPAMSAGAATKDQLKQQKAEANAQINQANSIMKDLEAKNQNLIAQIGEKNAALVQTLASIDSLTAQIADQEEEIESTKADLAEAEEDRDKQYQDMKKRIQYLYENGGSGSWAQALLAGENISSMLNRVENTQKVYEADRKALEKYVETVAEVTALENQLEEEKADMEATKAESESEKANLESQLSSMKATSEDYNNQLDNIKAKAAQYSKEIQAIDAKLEKIRKQEAEAARIAAEKKRAEERRKAQEEANRKNNANKKPSNGNNNSSSKPSNGNNNSSNKPSNGNGNSSNKPSNGNGSGSSGSSGSGSSGSVGSGSGQAVVNYATQFVGNPYVWGGTSLTNGADCSGFILSVYKHFGVSLPHSSAAMRSVGRGVSYSEARAGDIICYSGHVAIYMGGGAIVHASNKKDGIKISPNAAYRPILAVRRIF